MNPRRDNCCAACRHFNDRAPDIEAQLPGLSSLSSAYAAVRSADGLCRTHDRYVAANSLCAAYSIEGIVSGGMVSGGIAST
jgi:hypothetical protein